MELIHRGLDCKPDVPCSMIKYCQYIIVTLEPYRSVVKTMQGLMCTRFVFLSSCTIVSVPSLIT